MPTQSVIWHDLECGSYDADLACWRALADQFGGPILDVGCGTGRVALTLAADDHSVTALDCDAELLSALANRADGLRVSTLCADARDFKADRQFKLIIVPMLTVQMFGGADGRRRFFRAAKRCLTAGGCLALAIADLLEDDEPASVGDAPAPDRCTIEQTRYATRPVALTRGDGQVGIERRRERSASSGEPEVSYYTDWVDTVSAEQLESEGAVCGLALDQRRWIPSTDEYIGSAVICFHA